METFCSTTNICSERWLCLVKQRLIFKVQRGNHCSLVYRSQLFWVCKREPLIQIVKRNNSLLKKNLQSQCFVETFCSTTNVCSDTLLCWVRRRLVFKGWRDNHCSHVVLITTCFWLNQIVKKKLVYSKISDHSAS